MATLLESLTVLAVFGSSVDSNVVVSATRTFSPRAAHSASVSAPARWKDAADFTMSKMVVISWLLPM